MAPARVAEEHQQVAEAVVPLALVRRQLAVVAPFEDVPGALGERHQRGMDVAADEQHRARGAARDQRLDHLQPVGEAGALLADVERRQRREAEALLDQAAGAREIVVRRHRGAHQVVDLAGLDAGVGEGGARRLGAEVGGGDALLREAPLLDAAALAHPLVVGLDDARQGVVVEGTGRQGDAAAGEDRAWLAHLPSSEWLGWAAGLRDPRVAPVGRARCRCGHDRTR